MPRQLLLLLLLVIWALCVNATGATGDRAQAASAGVRPGIGRGPGNHAHATTNNGLVPRHTGTQGQSSLLLGGGTSAGMTTAVGQHVYLGSRVRPLVATTTTTAPGAPEQAALWARMDTFTLDEGNYTTRFCYVEPPKNAIRPPGSPTQLDGMRFVLLPRQNATDEAMLAHATKIRRTFASNRVLHQTAVNDTVIELTTAPKNASEPEVLYRVEFQDSEDDVDTIHLPPSSCVDVTLNTLKAGQYVLLTECPRDRVNTTIFTSQSSVVYPTNCSFGCFVKSIPLEPKGAGGGVGGALLAALVVFITSFFGPVLFKFTLHYQDRLTQCMVPFGAGCLLCWAVLLLRPSSYSLLPSEGTSLSDVFILLGALGCVVVDLWAQFRAARWRMRHRPLHGDESGGASTDTNSMYTSNDLSQFEAAHTPTSTTPMAGILKDDEARLSPHRSIVWMCMVADILASIAEGISLASAYLTVGESRGWGLSISILLCTLPRRLSFYFAAIHAGVTGWKALICGGLLAAFCCFGGVIIGSVWSDIPDQFLGALLALASGIALVVSLSKLAPQVLEGAPRRDTKWRVVLFVIGCASVSPALAI